MKVAVELTSNEWETVRDFVLKVLRQTLDETQFWFQGTASKLDAVQTVLDALKIDAELIKYGEGIPILEVDVRTVVLLSLCLKNPEIVNIAEQIMGESLVFQLKKAVDDAVKQTERMALNLFKRL